MNKKITIACIFALMLTIVLTPDVMAALQSRPGVTPLVNTNANTYFKEMRNMEAEGGVLGLSATFEEVVTGTGNYEKTWKETSDSNDIDAHMIKNSEWGAVAILSNSKYGAGIGGVKNTTSTTTGGDVSNSTTGNAYGVFGMYGTTARIEFVAGTYNGANATYMWDMGYIRYSFLRYRDMSTQIDGGGIPGDAMTETKNLSGGGGINLRDAYPIIQRGNNGILSYNSTNSSYGSAANYIGSRAAIVCGEGI